MPKESLRVFIAIEIQDRIKDAIENIQEKLKKTNSIKGKWVSKENIHLTLKFLGDTQIQKIDKIKECIEETFREKNEISCSLKNVGTFPPSKSPRVVWVGIENKKDIIAEYADRLEDSLLKLHFKKEKRSFKSHITICRVKNVTEPQLFTSQIQEINKEFPSIYFQIEKITLFESKLTPQGPIYTSLFSFSLKK